jgi:hypothetical protein
MTDARGMGDIDRQMSKVLPRPPGEVARNEPVGGRFNERLIPNPIPPRRRPPRDGGGVIQKSTINHFNPDCYLFGS